MPKGVTSTITDEPKDPGNVGADDLSTNEQANVLPIFAGEAKFALIWLCLPFNEFSKDAEETSVKKA